MCGKISQTAFFIEGSNGVTWKDQDAILNQWKECFSDLLNPVDATSTQIHEEQVGEDIQITKADVNVVIKSLKTKKAPDENDISPEMLKAMNMYGVYWLTCICKVVCRVSTKAMANQCDNTYSQERRQEKMHQL